MYSPDHDNHTITPETITKTLISLHGENVDAWSDRIPDEQKIKAREWLTQNGGNVDVSTS